MATKKKTGGYSGVQAGNLAVLAGALVIVLAHFGISLGDGDAQILVGAAGIILGPVVSWVTELLRGKTNVAGFYID